MAAKISQIHQLQHREPELLPGQCSRCWFSSDVAGGASDFHGYALDAASPFYHAAADGTDIGVEVDSLDVAFSAGRGCSAVSAVVEESSKRGILVYPNPAHDLLQVEAPGMVGQRYTLRDMLGRTMLAGVVSTERFEVRMSELMPGVYVFVYRQSWKYPAFSIVYPFVLINISCMLLLHQNNFFLVYL